MTVSIKFSEADTNRNGMLSSDEFRNALRGLVARFDLNEDGYISNGQGWLENRVNEITDDFKKTVPFDTKLINQTVFGDKSAYSVSYTKERDGCDSALVAYAWNLIGGRVITAAGDVKIIGFVTKDQIRDSGWKFIDVDK
jgi:hypothetical protein